MSYGLNVQFHILPLAQKEYSQVIAMYCFSSCVVLHFLLNEFDQTMLLILSTKKYKISL
jgi:hypothetical protein